MQSANFGSSGWWWPTPTRDATKDVATKDATTKDVATYGHHHKGRHHQEGGVDEACEACEACVACEACEACEVCEACEALHKAIDERHGALCNERSRGSAKQCKKCRTT